MSTIESRIDDLYRGPLGEFVSARKALASELAGDERRRVQELKKPTTVPWAANQVYWRARPEFDRLIKTGAALRKAQVAALKGRSADVREAVSVHREAVADVVAKAIALASGADVHPDRDALTQTFEALSLASSPEAPGRLTQPLRPGGFEMLAGVAPAQIAPRQSGTPRDPDARLKLRAPKIEPAVLREVRPQADQDARPQPSESSKRRQAELEKKRAERERQQLERAVRAREREQQAEKKRREAAIRKAEEVLERAREKAADAERGWRDAQEEVERAAKALRALAPR